MSSGTIRHARDTNSNGFAQHEYNILGACGQDVNQLERRRVITLEYCQLLLMALRGYAHRNVSMPAFDYAFQHLKRMRLEQVFQDTTATRARSCVNHRQ